MSDEHDGDYFVLVGRFYCEWAAALGFGDRNLIVNISGSTNVCDVVAQVVWQPKKHGTVYAKDFTMDRLLAGTAAIPGMALDVAAEMKSHYAKDEAITSPFEEFIRRQFSEYATSVLAPKKFLGVPIKNV